MALFFYDNVVFNELFYENNKTDVILHLYVVLYLFGDFCMSTIAYNKTIREVYIDSFVCRALMLVIRVHSGNIYFECSKNRLHYKKTKFHLC